MTHPSCYVLCVKKGLITRRTLRNEQYEILRSNFQNCSFAEILQKKCLRVANIIQRTFFSRRSSNLKLQDPLLCPVTIVDSSSNRSEQGRNELRIGNGLTKWYQIYDEAAFKKGWVYAFKFYQFLIPYHTAWNPLTILWGRKSISDFMLNFQDRL